MAASGPVDWISYEHYTGWGGALQAEIVNANEKPGKAFPLRPAIRYLRSSVFFIPFAEEKGNAPDARECDEGVDQTGEDGSLSAADPRHDIEAEQSDGPPVERADDDEDQGNSIKHLFRLLS
jgi:hypothetical protein